MGRYRVRVTGSIDVKFVNEGKDLLRCDSENHHELENHNIDRLPL